jgi:hypothetical protein
LLLGEEEGDIMPQLRVYIEGVQLAVLVDLVVVLLVTMMQELQMYLHQHHHLFQLLHQDKEILVVRHYLVPVMIPVVAVVVVPGVPVVVHSKRPLNAQVLVE